jgi:hypothetical protein
MHCLFQSSYTASAIAVYLHQPVQYIFVAACSTTAMGNRFLFPGLLLILDVVPCFIGHRIPALFRLGRMYFRLNVGLGLKIPSFSFV